MKNILIIGANGSLGGAFMRESQKRNWHVRALVRNKSGIENNVEYIKVDAENPSDVLNAAQGVDAIFHGANPAGYKNWETLPEIMLRNSIAAALANNAILLFPGNIYNYTPDLGENIADNSLQNPISDKGQIRVHLEQILQNEKGLRTIILRMGDFFGANSGSSWLTEGIISKNTPVKAINSPSPNPDIMHQWAYLPDVAECFALLLERADELPNFARFNYDNHYFSMRELAAIIGDITKRDIKLTKLPWWLFGIISPFSETIRELIKMRYLWNYEMRFSGEGLHNFLGGKTPHTDLKIALKETLNVYGIL